MSANESEGSVEGFSVKDSSYLYTPALNSSSSSSVSLGSNSPPTSPDIPSDDDSALCYEPYSHESIDDGRNFVMVVGGLGYIGSHTTLELLKSGYSVVVVDDLSNSYASVLTRITKLAKSYRAAQNMAMPMIKFHRLDFRSKAMRWILDLYSSISYSDNKFLPLRKSRIIGVIHFAAYKSVEESLRKPLDYYRNNVCGLIDFLALLQQFNIRTFVFSSSATVYGAKTKKGAALKEDDLVHHETTIRDDNGPTFGLVPGITGLVRKHNSLSPSSPLLTIPQTSPYGRTKYFCESILADVAVAEPSWNIISLRYFNPVGCHDSGLLGEDPRQKATNLFPVLAKVLAGEQPVLEVFGSDWDTQDGTAVRDFIHVVDLARGHIAALDAALGGKVPGPFQAYNLGTGEGATVLQVVEEVEQASSQKIQLRFTERRAGDIGYCVAATDKAERELGWTAGKRLFHCARDMWNFISVNGNIRSDGYTCPP